MNSAVGKQRPITFCHHEHVWVNHVNFLLAVEGETCSRFSLTSDGQDPAPGSSYWEPVRPDWGNVLNTFQVIQRLIPESKHPSLIQLQPLINFSSETWRIIMSTCWSPQKSAWRKFLSITEGVSEAQDLFLLLSPNPQLSERTSSWTQEAEMGSREELTSICRIPCVELLLSALNMLGLTLIWVFLPGLWILFVMWLCFL